MRYIIVVNQAKALELGIKNINQAIIFDILTTASSWAEKIQIGNKTYFWVNRKTIANQLPILKLKDDTIYRHLKNLSSLGLIEYVKSDKKDCIRISKKGKKYIIRGEKNSEIKPIVDMNIYMQKWNSLASRNSLSKITSLTKSRREKLDARLKSGEFEKLFERALDEIAKSQYLLGAKGWKVTFDWLIKNDENILKVVEGNYRDGEKKNPYADSLLNNLPKNYVVEDW
jgi:DNA-binding PadR family transcriptional regulator